jgi:putative component of membrane protein insertase Oxa1/YidC/SpoIIIJ protein YidD
MKTPHWLLLFIALLPGHVSSAGERESVPWLGYTPSVTPPAALEGLRPVTPAQVMVRPLFRLYQRGVGASKGQTCPMVPSCSEYSRLAVARRGFLKGVLMSSDRLHRCGHDLSLYAMTSVGGKTRFEDPVE